MNLQFSSRLMALIYTLTRFGDTLKIDGKTVDFSAIPDGASYPLIDLSLDGDLQFDSAGEPRSLLPYPFASDVARVNGVLHLTLTLPHGANAPHATRFPATLILTMDGPVTLPPNDEETDQ